MSNKIYVGNLPYTSSEEDLQNFFSSCGSINDVHIIKDRETGRSRGFGFVTFDTTEGFQAALEQNNQELDGRSLRINKAEDKPRR